MVIKGGCMNKITKFALLITTLFLPSFAFAINLTPSASDPSVMYLSYIFGVVNGVLHGSGTQILGKMFGIFNMSVLMLASIIAVYTTLMAVLNTGQDGEFLGKKWSSLFVPVRVLSGVLLITPTSTGYSWIQVGVMWMVLQGVGCANYVWEEAKLYLTGGGTLFFAEGATNIVNVEWNGSTSNPTFVFTTGDTASGQNYETVYSWMKPLSTSVFCLEAMNTALNKFTGSTAYQTAKPAQMAAPTVTPFGTVISAVTALIPENSKTTTTIDMPNYPALDSTNSANTDTNWHFLNGICGRLSLTNGTVQTSSDGSTTNVSALGMQQALYTLDNGIYVPSNNICGIDCAYLEGGAEKTCTNTYSDMLMTPPTSCKRPGGYNPTKVTQVGNFPEFSWTTDISDAYSQTVATATNDYIGLVSTYDTGGSGLETGSTWLDAGGYYFELMSYVGGTQQLHGSSFTVLNSSANSLGSGGGSWLGIPIKSDTSYLQDCPGNTSVGCVDYPSTLKSDAVYYMEGILLPLVANKNMSEDPNNAGYYVVGNFLSGQTDINGDNNPMGLWYSVQTGSESYSMDIMAPLIGSAADLYNKVNQLTRVHDTSENPVVILMQIGREMINTAFEIWLGVTAAGAALGSGVGAIPSSTISTGVSIAFMGVLSVIMALVGPLMIGGAMLLFYFPLVPFMIYTFGVIGWIIGVIEGMVAAPIVGIGIMHPEGHDIFGKGDQALMLLLNMFLRPALMVFGLITSIMLVYVSVFLINTGINKALGKVYDVMGGGFPATLGTIAIPLIYTVIIFNVVGKCFTMIYILPDKVTRWLTGGLTESMGSEMAGVEGQVKQSAQGGMGAVTGAVGKSAEGGLQSTAKMEGAAGEDAAKVAKLAASAAAG